VPVPGRPNRGEGIISGYQLHDRALDLLGFTRPCTHWQVVNVLGFNITGEECVVLVRAGGEYLPATCLPLDPALAAYVSTMNLELVHLQVGPGDCVGRPRLSRMPAHASARDGASEGCLR